MPHALLARLRTRRSALALSVLGLAALLLAACSADPICALGGRGWCENGVAALAAGAARAEGFLGQVAVVQSDFAVDMRRYGLPVQALAPGGVEAYLAALPADAPVLVVSDVQVVNAPGPGNVQATGSALLTYYRGRARLRSERLSARLLGGTWQVSERTATDRGGG